MTATVLLVEDDGALREVLTWVLADDGYVVHAANDGLAALAILDTTAVDLIVTDLNMPRLDGVGLLAALRQRRIPAPVIVISAVAPPPLDEDVAAILAKPFDIDTLLTTVEQVRATTSTQIQPGETSPKRENP